MFKLPDFFKEPARSQSNNERHGQQVKHDGNDDDDDDNKKGRRVGDVPAATMMTALAETNLNLPMPMSMNTTQPTAPIVESTGTPAVTTAAFAEAVATTATTSPGFLLGTDITDGISAGNVGIGVDINTSNNKSSIGSGTNNDNTNNNNNGTLNEVLLHIIRLQARSVEQFEGVNHKLVYQLSQMQIQLNQLQHMVVTLKDDKDEKKDDIVIEKYLERHRQVLLDGINNQLHELRANDNKKEEAEDTKLQQQQQHANMVQEKFDKLHALIQSNHSEMMKKICTLQDTFDAHHYLPGRNSNSSSSSSSSNNNSNSMLLSTKNRTSIKDEEQKMGGVLMTEESSNQKKITTRKMMSSGQINNRARGNVDATQYDDDKQTRNDVITIGGWSTPINSTKNFIEDDVQRYMSGGGYAMNTITKTDPMITSGNKQNRGRTRTTNRSTSLANANSNGMNEENNNNHNSSSTSLHILQQKAELQAKEIEKLTAKLSMFMNVDNILLPRHAYFWDDSKHSSVSGRDKNKKQISVLDCPVMVKAGGIYKWTILVEEIGTGTYMDIGVHSNVHHLEDDKFLGDQVGGWGYSISGKAWHNDRLVKKGLPVYGKNTKIYFKLDLSSSSMNGTLTISLTRDKNNLGGRNNDDDGTDEVDTDDVSVSDEVVLFTNMFDKLLSTAGKRHAHLQQQQQPVVDEQTVGFRPAVSLIAPGRVKFLGFEA